MKSINNWEVVYFFLVLIAMALLLAGCSHNIHVKGWGFASPYGAIGCGTFACVKDNTSVEVSEKTPQMESKSKFVVGNQTTGYDVKLAKQKEGESVSAQ